MAARSNREAADSADDGGVAQLGVRGDDGVGDEVVNRLCKRSVITRPKSSITKRLNEPNAPPA